MNMDGNELYWSMEEKLYLLNTSKQGSCLNRMIGNNQALNALRVGYADKRKYICSPHDGL